MRPVVDDVPCLLSLTRLTLARVRADGDFLRTISRIHCNHILYENYTSELSGRIWIIRQLTFANHVWPIRCGAWVASKSQVVVPFECSPRSTTTPAGLDLLSVHNRRRASCPRRRFHPRPPRVSVHHLASHQSVSWPTSGLLIRSQL